MLNEMTFGNTPAALYLVRRLNELDNRGLTRACTVRINTFNESVKGIVEAVTESTMSAKVAANLLRLLRQEATEIELDEDLYVDANFVSQLLRNVIIGKIKREMRRTSIARKVEVSGASYHKVRAKGDMVARTFGEWPVTVTVKGLVAGMLFEDGDYVRVSPVYHEIKDDVTPEVLMERSNRRCARQGKAHMTINTDAPSAGYNFGPISAALKGFFA